MGISSFKNKGISESFEPANATSSGNVFHTATTKAGFDSKRYTVSSVKRRLPINLASGNAALYARSDGSIRCRINASGFSGPSSNVSLPFTSSSSPDTQGNGGYGHGGGTSFGHDPPHFNGFFSNAGISIGGSSNNATWNAGGRGYSGWQGDHGGGTGWLDYRVKNAGEVPQE
jgi:hypothetical protein